MSEPVTFIGWNFKESIATRYQRNGECNGCGDCCRKLIFVGFPEPKVDEYGNESPPMKDSRPQNYIDEFMEPEFDNPKRLLWRYDVTNEDNDCTMLRLTEKGGNCHIQDLKPRQCSVFPTHPNDIKTLTNCSYTFEALQQWAFEESK